MIRQKNLPVSKIKSIGILRALNLGDLIVSLPAFMALRAQFPHASIAYFGLPWSKNFFDRFDGLIDEFIEFPGFPGFPEREYDAGQVVKFIEDMQKRNFDLIIQMQGNGTLINPIIELMTPKFSAGFYTHGAYKPTEFFLDYPENDHQQKKFKKLLNFLGIETDIECVQFPIKEEEKKRFEQNKKKWGLREGNYILIHPGSSNTHLHRRWDISSYASLSDKLASAGLQVVFSGVDSERELIGAIQSAMQKPSVNLGAKTDLGQLALLVKHARLFISSDTGVFHLALLVNTPTITFFFATDPKIWGPIGKKGDHIVLKKASVDSVFTIVSRVIKKNKLSRQKIHFYQDMEKRQIYD